MKKSLTVVFVLILALIPSIIISSSLDNEFYQFDDGSYHLPDDVYDIVPDTAVPFALDSNVTRYRWYNGTWWVKYGNLAGWGQVSEFYLTDYLDQLGVLTSTDLQSDLSAGLGFPNVVRYYAAHQAAVVPLTMNSLAEALASPITQITFNQLAQGEYLNSDGTSSQALNYENSPFYLQKGFLGLASLMGNKNSAYNSLGADGYSVGSEDSNYLRSLVRGQIGLATLLGAGQTSGAIQGKPYLQSTVEYLNDINLSLMGGQSLIPSGSYPVGYPGKDSGIPISNLAQFLEYYLVEINRGVVSADLPWLGSDGIVRVNENNLNQSLADISAQGFMGLASILRGSADPSGLLPATYTKVDYVDLTKEEYQIDTILEAILFPLQDLQNDFATFLYSHGTDLDVEMRDNMKEQSEAFVDSFTSPGGDGTPSAGNITDTAGVSGSLKGAFSSSASPADAFNAITDDGNYGFLSSQTQQELNPFYNSSRSRSISDTEDHVYSKLDEITGGLGSKW